MSESPTNCRDKGSSDISECANNCIAHGAHKAEVYPDTNCCHQNCEPNTHNDNGHCSIDQRSQEVSHLRESNVGKKHPTSN